jgi:hypothetical protein
MIIIGIGELNIFKIKLFSNILYKRTLQSILAKNKLSCIYPSAARVIHFGNCGSHHRLGDCDFNRDLEAVASQIEMFKTNFFPLDLFFDKELFIPKLLEICNGGWGDLRDQLLCQSFVNKTFLNDLDKLGVKV